MIVTGAAKTSTNKAVDCNGNSTFSSSTIVIVTGDIDSASSTGVAFYSCAIVNTTGSIDCTGGGSIFNSCGQVTSVIAGTLNCSGSGSVFNSSVGAIEFSSPATINSGGNVISGSLVTLIVGGPVSSYYKGKISVTWSMSGSVDLYRISPAQAIALQNITVNYSTFGDATAFWQPAAAYSGQCYVADQGLTIAALPDYFSAAQINNLVTKFAAAAAEQTGHFGIPVTLNPSTAAAGLWQTGAGLYPQADGPFMLPLMCEAAYKKNGSLTTFNATTGAGGTLANATVMKNALQAIPRGVNNLVYVDPAANWQVWGFASPVVKGEIAFGSLLYYQAAMSLSRLYAANGDAANAATMAADAALIKAGISTLFNAGDGMYRADDGKRQCRQH